MRSSKFWLVAAVVALVVGVGVPQAWAVRFSDARIIIEINATDGDAGIQMFVDGEDWERLRVFDPDGRRVLDIKAKESLGVQGLTELFFESAEPSFDEQPLDEFLGLFPEGYYRFRGKTTEGRPLYGKAMLTHDLPGAPVLVAPIDGDDSVDPDNTVVVWQPVADPPGSSIIGYEVIVLREDPSVLVFSADVGPETHSVTVPPEFMLPETEYKYEVLAIEESGNQTLSEAEFETEE